MPERYEDQVSRVEQMIEDDGLTWDLSPNDKAALAAVLQSAKRYAALRAKATHLGVNADDDDVFTATVPGGLGSLDAAVDSMIEKHGL